MQVRCADLLSKISQSVSLPQDPAICARSLSADLLRKMSVAGSLRPNPVVPLLQDVFVRISAPASRVACARSPYEDLLCKMSVSAPLGSLARGLHMRIYCARCLSRDLCIRDL